MNNDHIKVTYRASKRWKRPINDFSFQEMKEYGEDWTFQEMNEDGEDAYFTIIIV